MKKFRHALIVAIITLSATAFAGNTVKSIDKVTVDEIISYGYTSKSEMLGMYTKCISINNEITKTECKQEDYACIKAHTRWRANNCTYHSAAVFSLLGSKENVADFLFSDIPYDKKK